MFRLGWHTFASSLVAAAVLLSTEVRADAVSGRMKAAMADCVASNADRIGAPIEDTALWSDAVAGFTAVSFSMINLLGTDGYANIEEAMISRTRDALISGLEDRGFKGFRSQAIETVQYCMPFALAAASNELTRQENAVCPDDTDYIESVEIIKASEADLRKRYGNSAERVREGSLFTIRLTALSAFPEVFRYGQEEYPLFAGDGANQKLHSALDKIELDEMAVARPLVDLALNSIDDIEERSERLEGLRAELICFKDWLDVYPASEVLKLKAAQ